MTSEQASGGQGGRYRLLDLFSGAGGAAMGYSRAGFEVVGVDNRPQKNYPFEFIQADALEFMDAGGWHGFDAIHASPPCQGYSIMNNLPWIRERTYPLLIPDTRDRLLATGLPYIIENVAGARFGAIGLSKRGIADHGLQAGWLCGGMFGLEIYRHRYFETNWFWATPGHPRHRRPTIVRPHDGGPMHHGRPNIVNTAWRAGHDGHRADTRRRQHLTERKPGSNGAQAAGAAVGHAAGWQIAAEAMGIDWMKRAELTQAIPPVMTEYIGRALLMALQGGRDGS